MNKTKIVSWNVENLFRPESGGPRFDYTPIEGWTNELYQGKIKRIGTELHALRGQFAKEDFLFAFQEIENEKVLSDIVDELGPGYDYIKTDKTFDYLDVGLIYSQNTWEVTDQKLHKVFERFDKPDILEVELKNKQNQALLTLLVVHLKARPANKYFTSMYRRAVCDSLQAIIWQKHGGRGLDRLIRSNKDPNFEKPTAYPHTPNVLVVGDFNDDPFSSSLMEYLLASFDEEYVKNSFDPYSVILYNTSWKALGEKHPGSNYYEKGTISKWNLLDQIILSKSLLASENKICFEPNSFTIHRINCDESGIPRRICKRDEEDNIIWNEKGISDHLPVSITLTIRCSNSEEQKIPAFD